MAEPAAVDPQAAEHTTVKIIVNGQPHEVPKHEEITFDQIVNLAYDNSPPTGENVVFTVTYKGKHGKHQGSLLEGQSVEVHAGMIFNVTATDKS
jgi:hypothetical protein